MSKLIKIYLLVFCLLLMTMNIQALAVSITITDNYWGANPSHGLSDRDVVGEDNLFGVNQMVVTGENGKLQYVDVYSSYLDNIGQNYTTLGDLFLSTNGWSPNVSDRYIEDNFHNSGEVWEYALVLDNNLSNTGGTFGLYQIIDSDDIILSNAPAGYAYREGQEVLMNTSSLTALATGEWTIYNLGGDDADDYLRFNISSLGYDVGSSNLGFHWAMTCGNDVIEGGAVIPTPEPGSILLLGSGLISFGIFKRMRRKKNTSIN